MKLSRRLVVILLVGLVMSGMVASGGYWLLNRMLAARFKAAFAAQGSADVTIGGFTTYYDGVVMQSLTLGKQFRFGKIYMQGKPWQLWWHPSKYIRIYAAAIIPRVWLTDRLIWPFPASATIAVNQFTFQMPLLGREIVLHGTATQEPHGPLLAEFASDNSHVKLTAKAELGFDQSTINSIAVSFDDAEFDLGTLKMRRGGGWVNFNYASRWTVSGELTTGYLLIDNEPLLDTTVKISGNAAAPIWTMTAREQADPAVWNFDLKNAGLTIHRGEQAAFMNWQRLDEAVLDDVALLMRSLKDPVAEEPPMPQ